MYEFSWVNLGIITSIALSHDDAGLLSAWTPDHVRVENMLTGRTAFFVIQRRLENHATAEIFACAPATLESRRIPIAAMSPAVASAHGDLHPAHSSPRAGAAMAVSDVANGISSPGAIGDFNSVPKSVLAKHDELHMALAAAVNKLVRYYSLRADPALYLPEDVVGFRFCFDW